VNRDQPRALLHERIGFAIGRLSMNCRILLFSISCACAALGDFGGSGGGGSSNTVAASTAIKHIVVIFQENRTPDNLFHGLPTQRHTCQFSIPYLPIK